MRDASGGGAQRREPGVQLPTGPQPGLPGVVSASLETAACPPALPCCICNWPGGSSRKEGRQATRAIPASVLAVAVVQQQTEHGWTHGVSGTVTQAGLCLHPHQPAWNTTPESSIPSLHLIPTIRSGLISLPSHHFSTTARRPQASKMAQDEEDPRFTTLAERIAALNQSPSVQRPILGR